MKAWSRPKLESVYAVLYYPGLLLLLLVLVLCATAIWQEKARPPLALAPQTTLLQDGSAAQPGFSFQRDTDTNVHGTETRLNTTVCIPTGRNAAACWDAFQRPLPKCVQSERGAVVWDIAADELVECDGKTWVKIRVTLARDE